MSTCQNSGRSAHESAACCRELRTIFESALGLKLQLSCREGVWRRCSDDPGPSLKLLWPERAEFNDWLQLHGEASEPAVDQLRGQGSFVAIPLQRLVEAPVVLWTNIDRHSANFVRRFAGHVWSQQLNRYQQIDLTNQLDVFAEQVTTDFEELCWLRSLTEHLDLCDVKSDEQSVARAVLPSLRQVVKAESVYQLPMQGVGETPGEINLGGIISAGEQQVDKTVLLQLLAALAPQAGEHPTVWNHQPGDPLLAEAAGVRNCMLTKIGKTGHPIGWLLAVNKVPPVSGLGSRSQVGVDLNDFEFGTCEASLFNAAAVMLATHARNVALFREKEKLLVGVIQALINAIDAKDAYTCGHSDRVARIARRLAEELHVAPAECERVYLAGLLHDIGKIGVPDDVLRKPGGLTDEEFAQIKKHPEIGHSILKHVDQLSDLLPGVLHHHESIDGHGYPNALQGEQIPLLGRILAVADSFDAMTSSRPYRTAMEFDRAETILREGAGTQWDAGIVDAFFSAIDDIKSICQEVPTTAASGVIG